MGGSWERLPTTTPRNLFVHVTKTDTGLVYTYKSTMQKARWHHPQIPPPLTIGLPTPQTLQTTISCIYIQYMYAHLTPDLCVCTHAYIFPQSGLPKDTNSSRCNQF